MKIEMCDGLPLVSVLLSYNGDIMQLNDVLFLE
jgi:hypothetical protein